MRMMLPLAVVALAGLGACGRQSSLFAKHSIPFVAPSASADTTPEFVGRWTVAADHCKAPWVLAARSLRSPRLNCDFVDVQTSSAGYAVDTVCHTSQGDQPGRLLVMMPVDPRRDPTMTVSGAGLDQAVALQRCGS